MCISRVIDAVRWAKKRHYKQGLNLTILQILFFGFRHFETFTRPMSENPAKLSSYDGGCHCGQISYTAQFSAPIEEQTVNTCDCTDPSLWRRIDKENQIKDR